jgi:hypothetical protein
MGTERRGLRYQERKELNLDCQLPPVCFAATSILVDAALRPRDNETHFELSCERWQKNVGLISFKSDKHGLHRLSTGVPEPVVLVLQREWVW